MAANRLPVATAALTANGFSFRFFYYFFLGERGLEKYSMKFGVFFIAIFHYLFIYLAFLVYFRYTSFPSPYRQHEKFLSASFPGLQRGYFIFSLRGTAL